VHVEVHILQLASTGLAGHVFVPCGLAVVLLILGSRGAHAVLGLKGPEGALRATQALRVCNGATNCDLGACRALHANAIIAFACPSRSTLCRTAIEQERHGRKIEAEKSRNVDKWVC
jgi:hypothetical protein